MVGGKPEPRIFRYLEKDLKIMSSIFCIKSNLLKLKAYPFGFPQNFIQQFTLI
jgi:hypothetical protein